MSLNEIKQKLETKEETLETYTDFKKRYYIYRVDDIVGYLQRDNTELDKLFKEEQKMFNDLKGQLTPEQQKLLSNYSDNWIYIINEEVEELTKQILNDFEEER
jgi:flagellar motor switch protein FliG